MQVFALYSLVSFHTGCSKHLRRVELTSPLWDASDEIADPVTWCQHLLERWGICHFQAILGHSRVGGLGKESACQCRRHGFDPWSRKISWRRKWQPTPVFLPGKFHGQGSLAGYSPWGYKEWTQLGNFHFTLLITDIIFWIISWMHSFTTSTEDKELPLSLIYRKLAFSDSSFQVLLLQRCPWLSSGQRSCCWQSLVWTVQC